MNQQHLYAALGATLSPDGNQRKQAELALASYAKVVGFCPALLKIVVDSDTNHTIRQSAAVYLKNHITLNYREIDEPNELQLQQQDKDFLRSTILQALVQSHQLHRNLLCSALHTIISCDYPVRWPSLVDEIIQLMSATTDQNRIYAALLALCELLKSYKHAIDDRFKIPLFDIVRRTFPQLTELFKYLTTENTIEFAIMRKLIVKSFWYAMQLDMPDYFVKEPKNIEMWMDLFQKVYQLPVPKTNIEPNPYWGTKKWILHNIYRMFINNCVIEMLKGENKKKLAKLFMEKYSLPFLALVLNSIMDVHRKVIDMPNRVLSLCYYYLGAAIRTKEIYNIALKSKLDIIIKEVIFPQLIFTEEDRDTWHNDVQEYLRVNFSFIEDIYSVKIAAGNALFDLLETRADDAMPIFLNFVDSTFKHYNSETTQQGKQKYYPLVDGLLYAIGNMKKPLMTNKNIRASLEGVMCNYVLPQLQSPESHLRARACWVAGLYALIKWEQKQNVMNVVKCILDCLQHKEFAVKAQAGMALTGYIQNKTISAEIVPILPKLLEVYVNMMQEMDYGEVVESIDYLVDAFRNEMEPYALELCKTMAARFTLLFEQQEEDDGEFDPDDDDDDANFGEGEVVCANCLRVIQTLLTAIGDKNQPMLHVLQEILVPLLEKVLTDPKGKGFDFFEELCEVSACLTYYHTGPLTSPLMWRLFPALFYGFKEYATLFVHYIVPPIDNFISKGTDVFLSDPKYMEMVMYVINYFLSDQESVEKETQAAAKLASVILQQCRGRIDHLAPQLLKLIINRLSTTETIALRILLIDSVCDALLYSIPMTITFMEQNNCTMQVFQMWLQTIPKMKRIYDKKCTVLGLNALLSMPDINQLPKSIQNNIHLIINHCIKLLIKIRDQRIQEAKDKEQAEIERIQLEERILNGEHFDIEEEENEDISDDEEEDYEDSGDVDVTGILKTKPIQKLLKDISECEWDKQADDEELEEEGDDFTSGIDNIDENLAFGRSMIEFSRKYNQIFMQIAEKLPQDEQNALKQLMEAASIH